MIAEHKKIHNLSVLQMERWNQILTDKIEKAHILNLDEDFIVNLYEQIHLDSINNQKEIINQKDEEKISWIV